MDRRRLRETNDLIDDVKHMCLVLDWNGIWMEAENWVNFNDQSGI